MNRDRWQELVDQLRGTEYRFGIIAPGTPVYRIEFDIGLTDNEVAAVEVRFGFTFPPDLREFLQTALPHGPRFPDWRYGTEESLRDWLDQPRQGVLFDVEHNGFWLNTWGHRPFSIEETLWRASELVAAAPQLIPVFGHRMMPVEPHKVGNPVFSVHQTDIIYYGFDLADYLRHEFDIPGREPWPERIQPIRFWDLEQFEDIP